MANSVCKYYLQGYCRFGSQCRYKHEDSYTNYYDQNYYSNREYSGGSYRGYDTAYHGNDNTYRGSNTWYRGSDNSYRGNDNAYRGTNTSYRGGDNSYRESDNYSSRGNDHAYRGSDNSYRGSDYSYRGYDTAHRGNDYTYRGSNTSNVRYDTNTAYRGSNNSYRGNDNTYRGSNSSYRGGDNSSRGNDSYQGSDTSSPRSTNYNSNNQRDNTDNQSSIDSILKDIDALEKGNQWPLTCFIPLRGGSHVPGWIDYSPEEVRWKMYKAVKDGNVDECKSKIQQLYKEAQEKRNEFSYKPKADELLTCIETKKDHWMNFKSTSFGDTNSFQNQNSTVTANFNLFNRNSGAADNFFQQDISVTDMDTGFNSPLGVSNQQTSPFSVQKQDVQLSSRPFHDPNPTFTFSLNQNSNSNSNSSLPATAVSAFLQTTGNIANNQCTVTGSGGFQSKQLIGEAFISTINYMDKAIFSCLSDLTEDETALFKATTFKFGKVPLKPPSKELCDAKN